ncbi:MAG: bacterioferritin-associated ferredoxin [Candidatus Tectimicrobiota bacterium]
MVRTLMAAKRYNPRHVHSRSTSLPKTSSSEGGPRRFADLDPTTFSTQEPEWLRSLPSETQQPAQNACLPTVDCPPPLYSPPSETPIEVPAAPARTLLEGMKVVCICKGIKKSTFWKAFDTGARTREEVNRLTGAGSGGCHGRRCGPRIIEMLRDSHSS